MKFLCFLFYVSTIISNCLQQLDTSNEYYNKLKPNNAYFSEAEIINAQKGVLIIKLASGKRVIFKNYLSPNGNEALDKSYEYMGRINIIDLFFVNEINYESSSIIMVTKDGRKTSVWGIPNVSEDGKLGVAFSQSVRNNSSSNGIQLIRFNDGTFISKCQVYTGGLDPQELRWVNNKVFVVKFKKVIKRKHEFIYKKFVLE